VESSEISELGDRRISCWAWCACHDRPNGLNTFIVVSRRLARTMRRKESPATPMKRYAGDFVPEARTRPSACPFHSPRIIRITARSPQPGPRFADCLRTSRPQPPGRYRYRRRRQSTTIAPGALATSCHLPLAASRSTRSSGTAPCSRQAAVGSRRGAVSCRRTPTAGTRHLMAQPARDSASRTPSTKRVL
jgi:hypothetical protein